ncbi:MAG: elongation factor P maturation arginine rhamnosyltransferase EarP [Rubrivivax sp.]
MRWDLFCRVIDNHGDLGVCWRLACQLAKRGQAVRLWVDQASALAWMAGDSLDGVELLSWPDALHLREPGDVVIEAFGCDPPDSFVAAMAACARPPLWINLEYLSAEAYVERCHALPSPQFAGPGKGLRKWFFFPGFSGGTGGLLRESDLAARQRDFDATSWLHTHGLPNHPGERRVSVFGYAHAPIDALARWLAGAPTVWLLTPDAPRPAPSDAALGGTPRLIELPWLSHTDYDHLLWSCGLNLVRGEDSLVRALWAGAPFLWQIYAQADGAHAAKLDAFLDMYLQDADAALAAALRQLFGAWNNLARWPTAPIDPLAWRRHARAVRDRLWAQRDLVTQLLEFVAEKR